MLKRAIALLLVYSTIFADCALPLKASAQTNTSSKNSPTATKAKTTNFKTSPINSSTNPKKEFKEPAENKITIGHFTANPSTKLLKGSIIETVKASPLLYGNVQTIPKGTKFNLSFTGNLNSQLSNIGDEILARVSVDISNGNKVLLPGGWYMHGKVSGLGSQRRLGRNGYITVEFDKLLSPDGDIDLPFPVKFSTKDNQLKAISKVVLIDSGYVTMGAIGGSILSVQLTGLPLAISTHGISVGAGAAIGGGLGLVGALKRKGKIASFFPGDEVTITTGEPIELPGFDPRFLPSAEKATAMPHLTLVTNHYRFDKDPYGDKLSKQLFLSVTIHNDTNKEISLFDSAVLSDHGQRYYPMLSVSGLNALKNKAHPHSVLTSEIEFNVGSNKRKYWLILLDKLNREEIARCQIN